MIYLEHLLEATHGELRSHGRHTHFDAFNHDSRQLIPGELFVAVHGEHGNGHDYLLDAVNRGATGLLVEARSFNQLSHQLQQQLNQVVIIVVEDTRLALQHYTSFILQRWQPTVIAVTGSVGKTSTKEAIATVLSQQFATFRSWQNYNDLLGLPLSLGRLEERHQYAVLELGCDHPGEIMALCALVRPHIGVLTNISPVQLQYFASLELLAAELGTLLTHLQPGGLAVYNQDDPLIQSIISDISASHNEMRLCPYSPAQGHVRSLTWEGTSVQFPFPSSEAAQGDHTFTLSWQLPGSHHRATMLAAYTVAHASGMSSEQIAHGLTGVSPLPGRLQPLAGRNGTMLLDDTHNAAPASVLAGLHTLRDLPARSRVAILGDMLALGNYEEEAHRLIGEAAAGCTDFLVTRGEHAHSMAEAARQAGLPAQQIAMTSTHEDAAKAALSFLETASGTADSALDAILIKGSEATRMEHVTELLMAQPEQAPERLVRQTPGWKQIVVMRPERPTWIEIDLSAIGNNTRLLKEIIGPEVRLLVSLKADAYGHGALKVARTVLHNGASMLGVATVSEATPLRNAGITAPILVFGYVPPWQMREAIRQDVTVTLYTIEAAQALSRTAQALDKTVRVHLKVDTGMGRLGIRAEHPEDIVALASEVRQLPNLIYEGVYTHFASADATDLSYAHKQLERFTRILHLLEHNDLRPPIVHAANSAAVLSLPQAHFNMVRPGIAIYGLDPSPDVQLPTSFRPALSFKTQVSQVKEIPAGEGISYGSTFITAQPTVVAVLPVGYADGFRRAPYNWGYVLIHGQQAPILGRVCMDQCMVDVTHIPQVRIGDEVVLIGRQGEATLSAEQVAERLGTINYEVVAEILARVPRVD